jgi:hypothetical protein
MTIVSKPPKNKDSHLYRKWEESLVRQAEDTTPLTAVPFVTVSPSTALSNERTLTGTTDVSVTDNGAGSSVVIGLEETGVTPGSYSRASITVDDKGRISAASSGSPNAYVPEYDNSDPGSPTAGDVWVKHTYSAIGGGTMGGHFGHPDPGSVTDVYELSYRTVAGSTKRTTLS